MKVLLTGGSGFLGRVILSNISQYHFTTLGRKNSDVSIDLSKKVPELGEFDIVIHCAGKAHLIPNRVEEIESFYEVNVQGTINLLKGLDRNAKLPVSFVFISSVAVYGLVEGSLIEETNELLAKDPYGLSKLKSEAIIQEWCQLRGVICSILRLPLIASANPPGNLNSMIAGIRIGYYFNISKNSARKSIVLANDVAKIIPDVASIGGIYNLTDGAHPTVIELSELIASQLGKSKPLSFPFWCVNYLAKIGDFIGPGFPLNTVKLKKLTSELTFSDSKARKILRWAPTEVMSSFKIS